jgi:uncharacterized membrane protein
MGFRFDRLLAVAGLILLFEAANAHAWVAFTEPVHRTLAFFHVFGAIIFVGNIIVSASWMAQAKRSQSAEVLHFAARAVMRADWLFTLPGILLILVTGLLTIGPWGGFGKASWAELALALLVLAGLIWLVVLVRLQKRMIVMTRETIESAGALGESFHTTLRRWMVWGGVATLLPLVSLYLMVYKPKLWG